MQPHVTHTYSSPPQRRAGNSLSGRAANGPPERARQQSSACAQADLGRRAGEASPKRACLLSFAYARTLHRLSRRTG